MIVPNGMTLKLDPRDDYPHKPEAASNYNESMYFNAFDTQGDLGLWMRLGNRVNEGHAELSCCVYLPGGKVGFIHSRPKIQHNDAMDAGGMRFDVLAPFERLRASYEGDLLLMTEPREMADPKRAFANNPKVHCRIALEFEGVSPMHGGEVVNRDGTPWELDGELTVFRGHLEQHMAVRGKVEVDGQVRDLEGFGFRDKSWGPRHWQNFYHYKWTPMTFNERFGVMLAYLGQPEGPPVPNGHVFSEGQLHPLIGASVSAVYDEDYYQRAMVVTLQTAQRQYQMEGEVISLIPLRHRRTLQDGTVTTTRIAEGMTRFGCDGQVGYGMSEFLDLIENGIPISVLRS